MGAIELLKFEIDERIDFLIRNEHDVASVAAVTAVRTAVGNEFFAMERHFSVAAVACFDENFDVI